MTTNQNDTNLLTDEHLDTLVGGVVISGPGMWLRGRGVSVRGGMTGDADVHEGLHNTGAFLPLSRARQFIDGISYPPDYE